MTRPPASALALLLLAGSFTAPIRAQTTEGILTPAGHLRFEVASSFHLWEHRFGLREEEGAAIEESEPLGFDLEHGPLIPLDDLQARLRTALDDPALDLVLGSTRVQVAHERNAVKFGAALGVFDWLTLGFAVPLVEARTEFAFDFRALEGANLGLSPSGSNLQVFRAILIGSGTQLTVRRDAECPEGPACAALTDLAGRYTSFAQALDRAYDAPVFLVAGTSAADALDARLSEFQAEVAAQAPDVVIPSEAPLAAERLDEATLVALLTTNPLGPRVVAPFSRNRTPFQLGDVELTAAVRLLEGAARDSASAPARIRYLVGGRALVRLPTGATDDPDVPFDLGRGAGHLDVEVAAFADVRLGRLGVQAEGRRGLPQPATLPRRVAPPERALAPGPARDVRWTPGAYFQIDVAPRWHITDELAIGGLYRGFRKDADDYEDVVGVPAGTDTADILELETEATFTELGFGVTYTTVTSWREGRARAPLELELAVRKTFSGSGGRTPDGLRLEASGQVFLRLWGARPNAVR